MIENENRTKEENQSIELAEESREVDWKSKSFMASLFMGDLDVGMIYPFPEQGPEDKAIGDTWCAKVDAWCAEHIDGEEIDATCVIPAHVFRGLGELGMFGIKIPTKYGGLGLSQANYMRILATVSHHCASTAGTLSAHQSIGVPQPLKLFGTEEQKQKYLTMIAKGALTAFALTEHSVGSDPANMHTTAERSEDGSHWILNGEKLWCTNGVIADLYVVMARTPPIQKRGREVKQITAFVVERDYPGIEVMHQCRFMGIRAIENGLIRFTNVKVPHENVILGEGQGLRLALTTLNDGRLGIPAINAHAMQTVSDAMASWAKTRFQWGKFIGQHEAGSDKLARLGGGAYALKAFSDYCAAVSSRGDTDIRMEAAAAKLYSSEVGWDLVDTAVQLRGGRGYETAASLKARGDAPLPLERALRDSRINRIVEGTTDVMHLFLAREALDKHLGLAMPLMTKRTPLGEKFKTLLKCGAFYSVWYPKLWVGGFFRSYSQFDEDLAVHMRWVEARTRKLARTLFHQMLRFGPKLEMKQLTLGRLVDIGAELAVMALVASRAQTSRKSGDTSKDAEALYWLDYAHNHVDDLFRAIGRNTDAAARKVAKAMMDAAELLETTEVILTPMPEERGRDLISGRQRERLALGGTLPGLEEAESQASK
jgi:alkylation response protein AidB-like acyl-CoA dehydrogenase